IRGNRNRLYVNTISSATKHPTPAAGRRPKQEKSNSYSAVILGIVVMADGDVVINEVISLGVDRVGSIRAAAEAGVGDGEAVYSPWVMRMWQRMVDPQENVSEEEAEPWQWIVDKSLPSMTPFIFEDLAGALSQMAALMREDGVVKLEDGVNIETRQELMGEWGLWTYKHGRKCYDFYPQRIHLCCGEEDEYRQIAEAIGTYIDAQEKNSKLV
ncbi:MAG: hypothetical protein ACOYIG_11540, partial [Acetivibrionales bacterium]